MDALAASTWPLETERIRLLPFQAHHLTERYVGWLNDPVVVRYSEQRHRRHTLESCAEYFQSFSSGPSLFLAIETKSPLDHIGNITVDIDPPNALADISIMIGHRDVWGRGYGLEAWRGVMHWLLARTDIRKVTGGAVAANRAMIKIMQQSGMTEDGVRRAHFVIGGVANDVMHFAVIK